LKSYILEVWGEHQIENATVPENFTLFQCERLAIKLKKLEIIRYWIAKTYIISIQTLSKSKKLENFIIIGQMWKIDAIRLYIWKFLDNLRTREENCVMEFQTTVDRRPSEWTKLPNFLERSSEHEKLPSFFHYILRRNWSNALKFWSIIPKLSVRWKSGSSDGSFCYHGVCPSYMCADCAMCEMTRRLHTLEPVSQIIAGKKDLTDAKFIVGMRSPSISCSISDKHNNQQPTH